MTHRVSSQGDVVNYDEIKRFIQQELNKMFDGNRVVGLTVGCTPASPCPHRRALSTAASPHRAHGVLHLPDALPRGDGGIPGETGAAREGRAAWSARTSRLPRDAGADWQRGAAGCAGHEG